MKSARIGCILMLVVGAYANIIYKAKFIGNWRVSGDSLVVHALSVSHCLAICNKDSSCDAITYYDELNKCRLFSRCSPLQIIARSSHYWFYAKRPPGKCSLWTLSNPASSILFFNFRKVFSVMVAVPKKREKEYYPTCQLLSKDSYNKID